MRVKLPFLLFVLIKLSFILGTSSCGEQQTPEHYLANYLQHTFNFQLTDSIHNIVIVSEEKCMNCNSSLAATLINHLDHIYFSKTIIILHAKGAKMDISKFKQMHHPSIFINPNYTQTKDTMYLNSQLIELNNHKITHQTWINSDSLEEKLNYIIDKITVASSFQLK